MPDLQNPNTWLTSLRRKGMDIGDLEAAKPALKFKSYYRLKAYWAEFYVHPGKEQYDDKDKAAFEGGVELYLFDRQMRLLVFDAIERFEVAVKSCWQQRLSADGAIAYSKNALFGKLKEKYKKYKETNPHLPKGQEDWIKNAPDVPVVWVASEVMSFGLLIDWVASLRDEHKKHIAKAFEFEHPATFITLCRHLNFVRNICAHHGQLWSSKLDKPGCKLPNAADLPDYMQAFINEKEGRKVRDKLHNTLVVLYHLTAKIESADAAERWRNQLLDLIEQYGAKKPFSGDREWIPSRMGFPKDWRSKPPWKK